MFVRKKRGAKRGSKARKPKARKPTRPHLPRRLEQRHLYLIGLFTFPVEILYAQSELNRLWRGEASRSLPAAVDA